MYKETDIVRIAKRENNNKRNYLVVNRLQGKHIPVSATEAFCMFDELSEIVKGAYQGERLLLAGFAETATAIGARLAIKLDSAYMQTTREKIEGVSYLYFTESHSHATEQKLVKDDVDSIINRIDRIVFVEDEVTTGNTIRKIVQIIRNCYGDRVAFSVASILNGMDEEALQCYKEHNIDVHYLVKTNHSSYIEKAAEVKGDGFLYKSSDMDKKLLEDLYLRDNISIYKLCGYVNARRCVKGSDYENACNVMWEQIKRHCFSDNNSIETKNKSSILVIGTEEFMYPALFAAKQLEKLGFSVRTHSTTRSPIMVSCEEDYPFQERYELLSLYDTERVTYIYNLTQYDSVFVITDANELNQQSLDTLLLALAWKGNKDIKLFYWNEK